LGTALLTGPYLQNCADDWQMLADARGAYTRLRPDQLTDALQGMLNDPQIGRDMADNAAACAAEQGDDLARIVTELIALLPPKDTA
jgi:3-deoxy-D-manno-octulosonic-acid transferase